MSSDVLLEEFEVLESIYPTELSKLSDRAIQIDAEPDDVEEGMDSLKVTLSVTYTSAYPDELPEFDLQPVEGELDDAESASLLKGLQAVGEENLGMAMTFTLVSHLREQLSALVQSRAEKQAAAEQEKERLALEAEEARTRGTPVTIESFKTWKARFDQEMADKRAREEAERLKGMTAKEREEWKKAQSRYSGRQLFERHFDLDDDNLMEEGTVSVDVSQFERGGAQDEDEDEDRVHFSDSD